MRRVSLKEDKLDPKTKWKEIQENYDQYQSCKISKLVHHGDLSTTSRLLGYTDAVMATCATFLVIPIKHVNHTTHGDDENQHGNEETLVQFLDSNKIEVFMFFIGFLLVTTIWESTNFRSIVIKRLDDFLVILSVLQMLLTTLLPFTVSLQGHFPHNKTTVLATTIVLCIVEIIEAGIIFYAFASPRLLHIEMKNWPFEQVRPIRNTLLKKNIINIALISVGAVFDFYDYRASWVFFSLLILNPIARKIYLFIRRRQEPPETEHSHFYWFLIKGNISKERVEVFTDAATAIIACMMILDIIIEQFSNINLVHSEHLWHELKHLRAHFLTFISAYVGVSLLWYVNHTVIHLFHTINTVLLYLQKVFLCLLSLIPLCANILNDFGANEERPGDTKLAIQCASIIVFLASLCNVFMVLWGYHKKEKVFHQWAINTSKKYSRRQQLYTKMKVATIPYWTFVSFIGGFGSAKVAKTVAIICFVGICLTFFILKFLFVNQLGKKENSQEKCLSVRYTGKEQRGISRMLNVAAILEAMQEHSVGREPSNSIIARYGGRELTENEERINKLLNVEYDGNELITDKTLDSISEDRDNSCHNENKGFELNHGNNLDKVTDEMGILKDKDSCKNEMAHDLPSETSSVENNKEEIELEEQTQCNSNVNENYPEVFDVGSGISTLNSN